ncbi:hypothetical protein PFLmoz3_04505 [Pseudomonas fluorescens]|uniref:Uncharacterized protein n=1 Tax=Pseudomonas fluorescens TaxID=294 RepID=A0A109LDT1_PSEFL|nr:hypothetical protein PFLmoz3_04505 [Pseudomonas fluorescens]
MMVNVPTMNTITAYVRPGNSHILKTIFSPAAARFWRMRSCDTAITRYTSNAMAPELASRNSNTAAGAT